MFVCVCVCVWQTHNNNLPNGLFFGFIADKAARARKRLNEQRKEQFLVHWHSPVRRLLLVIMFQVCCLRSKEIPFFLSFSTTIYIYINKQAHRAVIASDSGLACPTELKDGTLVAHAQLQCMCNLEWKFAWARASQGWLAANIFEMTSVVPHRMLCGSKDPSK